MLWRFIAEWNELIVRTKNKFPWYSFQAQVRWSLAEATLINSGWIAFTPHWCCWNWWQHGRAVKTRSISLNAGCGFVWKGRDGGLEPLLELQTTKFLFCFACLTSLISECCVPFSPMLSLLALCQPYYSWHNHLFIIQLGNAANDCALFKHFGSSTCWRRTLLGDVISARNEQQTLNVTAKICHFLIEETQHVLLQVIWLEEQGSPDSFLS